MATRRQLVDGALRLQLAPSAAPNSSLARKFVRQVERRTLSSAVAACEVARYIFERTQEAKEHLRRIEGAAALGINPNSG